jgi:hypothetical protein
VTTVWSGVRTRYLSPERRTDPSTRTESPANSELITCTKEACRPSRASYASVTSERERDEDCPAAGAAAMRAKSTKRTPMRSMAGSGAPEADAGSRRSTPPTVP